MRFDNLRRHEGNCKALSKGVDRCWSNAGEKRSLVPSVSDSDQVRENHPKKSKVATPNESRSQRSELPKNPKIQTSVNESNNSDKAETSVSPEVVLDVAEAVPSEMEPLQEVILDIHKTEACNDKIKDADIDIDNKFNDEKLETIKRRCKGNIERTIRNTIDPLIIHEKEELMKLIEDFKEDDGHINAVLKGEKLVNEYLKWKTEKLKMNELVQKVTEISSLPKEKIAKLKTLLNNLLDRPFHFFQTFYQQTQGNILNASIKGGNMKFRNAMRQNTTNQNTRDEETQTVGKSIV